MYRKWWLVLSTLSPPNWWTTSMWTLFATETQGCRLMSTGKIHMQWVLLEMENVEFQTLCLKPDGFKLFIILTLFRHHFDQYRTVDIAEWIIFGYQLQCEWILYIKLEMVFLNRPASGVMCSGIIVYNYFSFVDIKDYIFLFEGAKEAWKVQIHQQWKWANNSEHHSAHH